MSDSSAIETATTPEYRTDPISGETVIIAPSRASRPNALASLDLKPSTRAGDNAADCPFCRGNEDRTPETLGWYPSHDQSHPTDPCDDWQVRVIPNLYPAVENATSYQHFVVTDPATPSNEAFGQHEVVIEGHDHARSVIELTLPQLEWTMQAYADRMLAHRAAGAAYSHVFKNNGRAAGASLAHSHSQIVAFHRVPPLVASEHQHCREYAIANNGGCLICDVLRRELDARERVVLENDDFVVYCPYASRLPYELCVMPKSHQPHFFTQTASERSAFARTVYQTVSLLEKVEKQLPFNYLIHTAPFDIAEDEPYHWHLELIPRLARQAGFEWGTGLHLNPVAPESAAAILRELT